ncbi:MAG: DUF3078 domain-containing protein [Elusimicrobia bacterium]|nr:DUF3078 domain-containing protein [Elusimicrobiota bacterium]
MNNTIRKTFILLSIIAIATTHSSAKWTKLLNFALTINQSKSKTGQTGTLYSKESLNYGILINGELTKDIEKYNWKNTLNLEYSSTKNKDESDPASSGKWTESNDKLTIDSIRRWKTIKAINPYLAVNFQTSMRDANHMNEWMAFRPLQFRESTGIGSPLISSVNQDLVVRTGCFIQHYANIPKNIGLYENSNGIELVLDYKNTVRKNIAFTSKAGFYSSFNKTQDPWNSATKSKKIKLEWDNTLITAITKYISLNMSWNIDNIDTTSGHANYEWEEKLNIALNWKVF